MKLIVEEDPNRRDEPEIIVRCSSIDAKLRRIIEQIRLYSFALDAKKDGVARKVPLEQILYIEAVQNRTFFYLAGEVLESDLKLYELETLLEGSSFVRIGKSCILNTSAVRSVSADINGRLIAMLENGERVVISKHYSADFRAKFN